MAWLVWGITWILPVLKENASFWLLRAKFSSRPVWAESCVEIIQVIMPQLVFAQPKEFDFKHR